MLGEAALALRLQACIVLCREELARRGVELDGMQLHAPIGLPLGGNSPGEIAISILAEVIGIRYETSQPA